MKIGIDIRPIEGTKSGIGVYTQGLLTGLNKIHSDDIFYLFATSTVETEKDSRFQTKVIPPSPLWHLQVANFVRSNKVIYHATHSLLDAAIMKSHCVLTIHDLTGVKLAKSHSFKVKTMNKLFFKRAVNSVSQVITPTQTVKDELVEYLPQANGKTNVIPEAVEEDFGSRNNPRYLEKYGLKPGFILFNATLEPRKNVPFLMEAYHKLIDPPPLVLVGKKGWGYQEIEEKITKLGLGNKVHLLDWVPDEELDTLYQQASLLVYPSISEGFGLSPLKGLKVGLPVIVSDLPVFNEVLGSAAFKINPNQVESLTKGMQMVLKDKKLREKLIADGFDQVSKYSWDKMAKMTYAVYQKVSL